MADFDNIKAGLAGEKDLIVEEKHTTSHTKQAVLSTPKMISLMESLAMQQVQPLLPSGFTTVGYEVSIKHRAPALLGTKIRVWCKLLEADGRKLLFAVRVSEGDKVIGEGLHRRTIIPMAG